MPLAAFSQIDNSTGTNQQTTAVNVLATDFKNKPGPGEQIIFISKKSGKKFSGRAGKDGKFSTTLPIGDTFVIKVKTIVDSTKYGRISIRQWGGKETGVLK